MCLIPTCLPFQPAPPPEISHLYSRPPHPTGRCSYRWPSPWATAIVTMATCCPATGNTLCQERCPDPRLLLERRGLAFFHIGPSPPSPCTHTLPPPPTDMQALGVDRRCQKDWKAEKSRSGDSWAGCPRRGEDKEPGGAPLSTCSAVTRDPAPTPPPPLPKSSSLAWVASPCPPCFVPGSARHPGRSRPKGALARAGQLGCSCRRAATAVGRRGHSQEVPPGRGLSSSGCQKQRARGRLRKSHPGE